jgi:hypothetical protein
MGLRWQQHDDGSRARGQMSEKPRTHHGVILFCYELYDNALA